MAKHDTTPSPYFTTRANKSTTPILVLKKKLAKLHLSKEGTEVQQAWAEQKAFVFAMQTSILLPGEPKMVLSVRGQNITPWSFAGLATTLPAGRYEIHPDSDLTTEEVANFCLGWGLSQYRFSRYKKNPNTPRVLVWPKSGKAQNDEKATKLDKKRVLRLLEAQYLVRDLINTPANDLGPAELVAAAREVGKKHGAEVVVTKGKKLETGYPLVHAVGRASTRPPMLVDVRWGDPKHPKVTLVGKGVIFDSGGLDIKSAAGMLTMKKDMGGAAHAIALAGAIMDAKLKVRLRLLVPSVENSVAGNAFRPLDVIKSRNGTTVEIGNTDAEGRLILCDALAEAASENPEFILDFATLTGAARVALGADLPAFFCNDESYAADFLTAGQDANDPLWRMPLFEDYVRFLSSNIADTSNTSSSRLGGAITAALFLRKFIPGAQKWGHIDVMAYNAAGRAGRPKGGEAMSLRAAYTFFEKRYG